MLIRNESRVRHFIEINLTYDDKENTNMIVNENDVVTISYRRNGRIHVGTGKITDIKIHHRKKRNGFGMKESAILIIDMSGECSSRTENIDIRDIIDIKKLVPKKCKNICDVDPSFVVSPKDEVGVVGMPISPGGVIGE